MIFKRLNGKVNGHVVKILDFSQTTPQLIYFCIENSCSTRGVPDPVSQPSGPEDRQKPESLSGI